MCLTLATDAACCAGSAICSCACCCCKNTLGTTFKEQIKIAYILLNVVMMLFTVFCLYWIQTLFEEYITFIGCPKASGGDQLCLGVSAVYRMSFVLACLYILLILCMLIRGEMAKAANEGLWVLKFLFIGAFFFGCLYIPNSFFQWYIDFARVVSGLYLIFQIIMLIDVFYLWGQSWIGSYEAGNEIMGFLLIGFTVILYGSAITLNIYNFIWFDGCPVNVFMNVFTIIVIVGITVVQLLGWNPQGSLICSGSMAIYITYQSYSAQASTPDKSCNQLFGSSAVMSVEISVGFVLSIVALLYLTFAVKEKSQQSLKTGGGADLAANFLQTQSEKDIEKQQASDIVHPAVEQQQQQPQQPAALTQEQQLQHARELIKKDELAPYENNQYLFFHIIMFVVAVYMAMMITNWGAPSIDSKTTESFQPSWASFWIKMITSWIAALIYIWTLIAPRLFPEREFS